MLEIISNLLLFVKQLLLIIKHLPFATATSSKVLALRLNAMRGWFHDALAAGFGVGFLFLHHECVNDVAWHHTGNENRHPFVLRHRLALGTSIRNFQIFNNILLKLHTKDSVHKSLITIHKLSQYSNFSCLFAPEYTSR